MEKLAQYLKASGQSQRSFADRIGIHHSVLSRFIAGKAKPSLSTALRIQRETDGQVPVDDWEDEGHAE
jgi:transcriptional regulator with XRE-family HTH domain